MKDNAGLNQDSRTMNAGKNAISAVANKIAILILTFVSRKFFIAYIGIQYLGINGLFANVLTLLSLADLGVGTAMNVSLYKPIADKDIRKISALLGYFKKIYRYIAASVFVIGMLLIPFLKYIVNLEQQVPHIYLYYVIFVMKNVVSYLLAYKSSIIKADQKSYLVNRIDVIINSFRVLIQCVIVILFHSYFLYILLEVLGVLAHNITVSIIANKNYTFILQSEEILDEEKKVIFENVSSVFLYRVSWTLLNGTDNILMSIIVGTVSVGLYSNYHAITSQIEAMVALLFTSLTASIGNLIAKTDSSTRFKTFQSMQMVSFWLCANVSVCLLFLTQDFIELWFGAEYLLDNVTLVAIVLNTFFSLCMRPVWAFREGTGMYRQIRYIMLVTAVLNIVLSILLGRILGVSGILFATSISKLLTYFWYEPNVLFKNFFNKSVRGYYFSYIKNILIVAGCCCLCYLPIMLMKELNFVVWIIKAIICVVLVNAIYLIYYHSKEEFKNILDKFKFIVIWLKKGRSKK